MVGKIIIDVAHDVNEFAVYEKYIGKDKYPNVIIEYTDKVNKLEPIAVELKFMGSEGENAEVFYRVLGKKGISNVGELISDNGPTGVAIKNPTLSDTDRFTYEFTGYWKSGEKEYYVEGLENPKEEADSFSILTAETDMVFYPIFKEEAKKHAIKFHDYDGNVILQNGEESFGVPYGMSYVDAGGPMTNFYYKDSSDLPDNKRYGFKGWSTSRYKVDEGKNIEFIDLKNDKIVKAMNLFPYYVTEDVYEVASSEEYFDIVNGVVSLKDEYKETLQGKITVPNFPNATMIGKFFGSNSGDYKVTHIYFLRGSNYTSVNTGAFSYNRNLKVVDLPSTIKAIENSAFYNC